MVYLVDFVVGLTVEIVFGFEGRGRPGGVGRAGGETVRAEEGLKGRGKMS